MFCDQFYFKVATTNGKDNNQFKWSRSSTLIKGDVMILGIAIFETSNKGKKAKTVIVPWCYGRKHICQH